MRLPFGRFLDEYRLVRELRRDAPDRGQLSVLAALLCDQARRKELPTSLLLKAELWAEKAMRIPNEDPEVGALLKAIHRGALGEVQLRAIHGL